MQDAKLKAALEQLREEINQSGLADGPTRTRLNGLISDLESNIGQEPDEQANNTLVEQVKESIGHLELEYPRTTTILNQILTTLGGAGI
ncbi:MAG: hypothetical protein ACI87O_001789 [Planctomycetota bacterium]|jgi:hypothetical protein